MPSPHDKALAMFAKAPRAGRVKTRLADAFTPEQAAAFHLECVRATWRRLRGLPGIEPFLYSDLRWPELVGMAGPDRFRLQSGGDLGSRMRSCLDDLHRWGYRRAAIVGSDAPTLPLSQVREAIAGLGRAEVVLGPAADGGFTLIAARRTAPAMFAGVKWSRGDTLACCSRAIEAAGLSVATTRTVAFDVDTPEDLERLRSDPQLPEGLRRWLGARPSEHVALARRAQGVEDLA